MATTDLRESVRRLESLVSPLVGPVLYAEEFLLGPEVLPTMLVLCMTTPRDLRCGERVRGLEVAGDRDSAYAASVGEAVERYSAAYVPAEALVLASAEELGGLAVDPTSFELFSAEQLAEPGFFAVPFTHATRVAWTSGFALPSGAPALLPAQLVYMAKTGLDEEQIGYTTSSGLASRTTLDAAVLTGLLELLERDAFSITWANRLSLPRLTWTRDESLLAFERRCCRPTGIRYAAIDLSEFWGVPTVLGVARSGAEDHAPVGVGAACAGTPQAAVRKALEEAFHVLVAAQGLREIYPDRSFEEDGSDVRTFDDHVHFHADDFGAARTAFLDASAETRDVSEIPPLMQLDSRSTIETVAERLGGEGISAYAVDVTAPDVRAAGLAVAKVVAPGLCPLDAEHARRHLGVRRLYEAAWRRGLAPAPLATEAVNPDPHPFP